MFSGGAAEFNSSTFRYNQILERYVAGGQFQNPGNKRELSYA